MNLTIIRDMGRVYVNGQGHDDLDMSTVPEEVHAVQWQETTGEIEYVDNTVPNTVISSLPDWAMALAEERQQVLAEEVAAKEAEEAARIAYENSSEGKAQIARDQRFFLLLETDWVSGEDVPQSIKDLYYPYRQALRDITTQEGFPESITWPTLP